MVMAFRIAPQQAKQFPNRKPKKNGNYLAFLHSLPCVVSGAREVQAAHLSYAAPRYGHYGRGKGSKAPDRWALPLSAVEHARQHSGNEEDYWRSVGINPHVLALTIHGLWSDLGDDAEPFATAIINAARIKR
jgi:hypothetical protein